MPTVPVCQAAHVGTLEYQQAWDLQLRLAQEIREGHRPNTLLLLEHPPVYTKGRLSKTEHLLLTPEALQEKGITIYETDRGGQVTFHGPGQLVAYPVVNLREWGGPVKYVRTLERIIIDTLADFDVRAGNVEGLTGVWVDDAKIAAIGVKISRGVAYHGLSLNVNTDLSYYDYIVPCGIEDRGVTSVSTVLAASVEMEHVRYSLTYHFGQGMGFKMVEADLSLELAAHNPGFFGKGLGNPFLQERVPQRPS
ncbi:MAG: hypothetical protein BZY75_03815 [SAR202 cluster bacterium Io17-Chloro-G7]|nr:MAG: hypothetical protein BZY75_03815 [SAR202 cluster bacterium Io17-Chloro-G7]